MLWRVSAIVTPAAIASSLLLDIYRFSAKKAASLFVVCSLLMEYNERLLCSVQCDKIVLLVDKLGLVALVVHHLTTDNNFVANSNLRVAIYP